MTTPVAVAFTIVAGLCLLALLGVLHQRGRRGLSRLLHRTLVVHVTDGPAIRGVLVGDHADCLVLAHARLLDADVGLGGEVVVLRERVAWAQDVTGMVEGTDLSADVPFTLPPGEHP